MSRTDATLLVVEPDQVTREMYVRELARTWRVLACSDNLSALAHLTSDTVNAVVLEPVMPGGENWSLVAAVRANSATATIPVLICSVVSDRGPGMALGATAHLVKPVAPHQLVKEVAHWLDPHVEARTSK